MDKEYINRVKSIYSILNEYSVEDILQSILLNDSKKLNEITNRCKELKSHYDYTLEQCQKGGEDEIIALANVKEVS